MKHSQQKWTRVAIVLFVLALALIFTPLGEWLRATPFIPGAALKADRVALYRYTDPGAEIGFYCYDDGSGYCLKQGFEKQKGIFDPLDPLRRNSAQIGWLLRRPPRGQAYAELVSCAKGKLKNYNTNLGWQYFAGLKENAPDWCKNRQQYSLGYVLTERTYDSAPLYLCRNTDTPHSLLTIDERLCNDQEIVDEFGDEFKEPVELLGYIWPAEAEICLQIIQSCTNKPNNQICERIAPYCTNVLAGPDGGGPVLKGNEGGNVGGNNQLGNAAGQSFDENGCVSTGDIFATGQADPALGENCEYCRVNRANGVCISEYECTCHKDGIKGQCGRPGQKYCQCLDNTWQKMFDQNFQLIQPPAGQDNLCWAHGNNPRTRAKI